MKMVNIRIIMDPANALETGSLAGNLWMVDDNRLSGSFNEGTRQLATAVAPGDQIVWTVLPIECETHVALHDIDIDPKICDVQQKFYPGTQVAYWVGTVKAHVGELPYGLVFEMGSRTRLMSNDNATRLVDTIVANPAQEGV